MTSSSFSSRRPGTSSSTLLPPSTNSFLFLTVYDQSTPWGVSIGTITSVWFWLAMDGFAQMALPSLRPGKKKKAEGLLSRVEQSPSESIQDTLPSFTKALMADKICSHSDEEVKVVVASCISEITRITAPDAPYDDDQMKDAFRLIVSSFENLHDKSNRLFAKRTLILETVARVRSCVVMLDLECDDLILEMFHHFLKSIREYHHKNVFESMVTIMTLIIVESEDVSPNLLSCLLAYVKKDEKEVSPISQALVENVLKNCASTLKPCLGEVLQSLGSTIDDYGDAVRSIFRDVGAAGMNHNHATGQPKKNKKQLSGQKGVTETGVEKSAVKEKKKLVSSSPKPFSKFSKGKQRPSDSPKTNNKGKGSPGEKSSDVKAYGTELIGFSIRVWWPQDRQFYEGVVDSFDSWKKKHKVVYNDGDQEILNLQKEKWEFVKESSGSDQDEATNDGSADASPELPLKKRVKRGMEESAKEGKKEAMTEKGGDTSSGKGKAMALKSGKRAGVGGKSGGKSGKNSKNKFKDSPVLNGKKSAASSENADESGNSQEKATDLDEPKDGDLLSMKASIKSKGRAGKTKKNLNVSSQEDASKNAGEPEKMDLDVLVNQKENEPNTAEVEGGNEKEDASGRDEANKDEFSSPEKGTESKTWKKRSRVA